MSNSFNVLKVPLKGINLIEAGAGTGKTYNIASLYVRSLVEKNLKPSQILVLTFTNDATAELRVRLRSRIMETVGVAEGGQTQDALLSEFAGSINETQLEHLKACLYHFDEAMISTIHGFCQKLLAEFSLDFGINPAFGILNNTNQPVQDSIDEFWRNLFERNELALSQNLRNYLQRVFRSPDYLRGKISNAVEQSAIEISNQTQAIPNFEKQLKDWETSFIDLKRTFIEEQAELENYFSPDKLNKNQYYKSGNNWPAFIGNWILTTVFPAEPHEKFIKFTPAAFQKGLKAGSPYPKHLSFFSRVEKYLKQFGAFKKVEPCFLASAIKQSRTAFEQIKRLSGVLGYNDLLNHVERGLHLYPELATQLSRKYPVGLIDEFQDTDHVQYSIFSQIFGKNAGSVLFMIGDPKQAIYRFRGADINTYLAARKSVSDNRRFTLLYNFRSSNKLIDAVNAFFNNSESPFNLHPLSFENARFPIGRNNDDLSLTLNGKEVTPFYCIDIDCSPPTVANRSELAMASTAHEIVNLLNKGYSINGKKINPGDIAVLVSRHSEADQMQAVLKLKKVPSVLNSKISVFNSRIARDLYLTLHAISNAANEQLIRAALGTELFGYNPKKLLDLVHDEIAWSNTSNRFSEANSIWHQRNFGYAIDFIISAFSIDKNLLEKESGLRDLTNIHHLLELLNKEELRGSNSPSALLGYFRKKMEPGAVQSEEDEIRLETDAKAVQIVTMHASKGLEYPIVFCPFLWRESSNQQNPFFTISNGKQLLMNVDPESEQYQAFAAQRREEEYSEKIRLTYVALTRAKSACFVHWYKQNKGVKSAINHLIDANSVQQSDASAQKKIHWKKAETSASTYVQRSEKQDRLTETKPFNRKGIQNFPRVLSYSSLAEKLHKETDANNTPGFDDDELLINNVVSSLADEETIFSLPRGKLTGNLVHAIFENIDFQNAATYEVQITEQLMKHRFDEKWKHVLKKLVTDTLQHDLALGLKLGDIPQYQRITEMQFYFQVEGIQSSRLIKMIRRQAAHQNQNQFGTLTGFIDLVFEYNGQFYVLDYKSNFLGDNNADYSAEAIRAEMIHANYDLQYHIYALALHRYLAANLQDYEYKKHFGGVIYLFLRGIDPGRPLSGVFSDKPDLELILKLDEYMKGESHAS